MEAITQEDWYESVQGKALEQGDILFQCPVFVPGKIKKYLLTLLTMTSLL